QFNEGFTFRDAIDAVPALHRLGVSHLYCSPIWAARRGSTHGYDVVDPTRLNPVLGSAEDFAALVEAVRSRDMGLIADIVPNHMAASPENKWWMDVIESGPASAFANFFGVRWGRATQGGEADKIFLPILGNYYGAVLESGELKLHYEQSGFCIAYYEHRFPIAPATYLGILDPIADQLQHVPEFVLILDIIRRMPVGNVTDWEAVAVPQREKDDLKRRLWDLYSTSDDVRTQVDRGVALFAGTPGDPGSFDRLDDLLQQQAYRLAFWRVATEKINYRRFFDVTDLIGIRVEDSSVFQATHKFVLELVASGQIEGLRVDHIDGLADPQEYLERLPEVYLLVEKILVGEERLPTSWRCHGTSGYDFLGYSNALFVEPTGLDEIVRQYASQTGVTQALKDVEYQRKLLIIDTLFPGEMEDLGARLGWLAEQDRHARDFNPSDLSQALRQVTACLAVYRTYTRSLTIEQRDAPYIESACEEASRRQPNINPLVYDFIRRVLELRFRRGMDADGQSAWLDLVRRWQQLSGPIMAKGVEDSTFYVHNPLVSLNEVGGLHEPVSPARMHEFLADRQEHWPHTMNASSTHDTKRSEDVRARINVLTEFAPEWNRLVSRWSRWLQPHRESVDKNEEWMLFQNLLGAWPLNSSEVPEFRERMKSYSTKAAREAREYTNWLAPSEEHENDLHRFIDAMFDNRKFLESFLPFQEKIAFFGAVNSLAQVLLKVTAPGLPDFYRGTLGWDFSLVDPDNRRPAPVPDPIDFAVPPRSLLDTWRDGRLKVALTERALGFRKGSPELFAAGTYLPLQPTGKRADHVFAFCRRSGNGWSLVAVPRFASKLSTVLRFPTGVTAWRDTVLTLPDDAPTQWRNVLTGARLQTDGSQITVHRLLESFPVGLLVSR
ncbi:MAG TPA: malto-oligosyltrehalose synthase, partial [Bryobacteraceae bacterium]|nr:malto-oligosyltrehalose synthase [Bryobacteraceae bacterium]